MSIEIPRNNPNKHETIDDNALKFTLNGIDRDFLAAAGATSFVLTTDWIEMSKDYEKKLALKTYPDGRRDTLLIKKITNDTGDRKTVKLNLDQKQYDELLDQSVKHLEKIRHEFDYRQNGTIFSMKYDEFIDSPLRILEVDGIDEATRAYFLPNQFPYELTNVTGEIEYYGHRIADLI
ncbi:hypothetical protein EON76_02940 [bacterium]|nr:MAG: hypothetical protein EON76_02940 [bacterium]